MKVVANIVKMLADKGISQAELSRRTEIDTATISKIFSGQTRLNVNALSEISTAIGVSVVDIITYPDRYVCLNAGEAEPLEAILQIRPSLSVSFQPSAPPKVSTDTVPQPSGQRCFEMPCRRLI